MSNLKVLRGRIRSVKSTQKITSAMKMVAAAKLRRAQEKVFQARPYAHALESITVNILHRQTEMVQRPILLTGNPANPVRLIIVATSDRGLCGSFNGNIIKETKKFIRQCEEQGEQVNLFCLGKKGSDLLRREWGQFIVQTEKELGKKEVTYQEAEELAKKILYYVNEGICGKISIIYATFQSVLTQSVGHKQLVPLYLDETLQGESYDFEPDQVTFVENLLPKNFAIQLYQVLLETSASEHGARMTAMDNATRNAKDVIKKLEQTYNRTRQAHITKELIEIISGAEAI